MKLYQEEVDKLSVRYRAGKSCMHPGMDTHCTFSSGWQILQCMCSDPVLAAICTDLHGLSKTQDLV